MSVCNRCGKEVGVWGGLLTFNKQTNRCGKCETEVKNILNQFRQTFIQVCQDGVLSDQKLQWLYGNISQERVDWNEALNFIRSDALRLLERTLALVAADGIITEDEAQYIYKMQQQLAIPPDLSRPLLERLQHLRYVSNIRQGKLPVVKPSIHLESDEKCHLEIAATYQKVNARSVKTIPGRFVATNKKLHFLSQNGGWTIQWSKIMRVERDSHSIYLELSTKTGNGCYSVMDSLLAEATIDALTRMAKRQLVMPQNGSSRHIPQDVKLAVWQRDGGKCVHCSATSYLEYDHIIPFSRGGASTIGNVQLLCRRCNLGKSDRI
ncbi:MAG: HNH endonuclease [Acidobacteriota bacterium]|nr:HNH endonuclease [Acidobacteriota bacterium]